jgi:hypothetical protein
LLFDLLTAEEEADRANVFDIPLLAERLVDVVRWLEREPVAGGLPVSLFGASTGAAAARMAAARLGDGWARSSRAAGVPTWRAMRSIKSARRRS